MGAIQSLLAEWPGDKPDAVWLLGYSWKTWGRIGKLMQYTGGLVALIDILGEDRFKKAALRIRAGAERSRRLEAFRYLPRPFMWLAAILLFSTVLGGIYALLGDPEAFDVFVSSLSAFSLLCVIVLSPQILGGVMMGLAYLSASSLSMKTVGFIAITVGFALDFLAS